MTITDGSAAFEVKDLRELITNGGVQELLDALNPYVSASYSNGVVSLKNAAGTVTSLDIDPVIALAISGASLTATKASGDSSNVTLPAISTFYTSGITGYVLFSNNFIIQWGQVEDLENNVSKVATLPHAMASTQYHLFIHRKGIFTSASSNTIYILNGRVNSATQIEVAINATAQTSLQNWSMSYLVIGTAA